MEETCYWHLAPLLGNFLLMQFLMPEYSFLMHLHHSIMAVSNFTNDDTLENIERIPEHKK